GSVIASALNIENLDSPEAFENFFPKIRAKTPSFIEEKLNRKSIDKTKFAVQCSPFMTVENMSGRFEWKRDMQMVIDKIQLWNR
ncbi:MAG: hypothetical protein GX776_06440, partial [Oxalobacter sp.]|nr:hypothetical protein [Oxalobacter sp.]